MIVEPTQDFIELWASGLADIYGAYIPAQYANWAYWYLGYDSPDFRGGEIVINEAIYKLTQACRLKLSEVVHD